MEFQEAVSAAVQTGTCFCICGCTRHAVQYEASEQAGKCRPCASATRRHSREHGTPRSLSSIGEPRLQSQPMTRPSMPRAVSSNLPEAAEAIEYARTYESGFAFMNQMHDRVEQGLPISDSMVEGILRSRSYEDRLEGAARKRFTTAISKGDRHLTRADLVDLSSLPLGHSYYAVQVPDSEETAFLHVERPFRGPMAGYTFVTHLANADERHFGVQLPGPGQVYRGQWGSVLREVVKDPLSAMAEYGRLIGECGRCGRPLVSEASRSAGLGPDCKVA